MAQRILVIEDDEFLGDIISRKLRASGYEVMLAREGAAGLALMRQERPDLILLDILMPNMNGYEVLESMQESAELRSIPVIIISNSGQPVEISRVMSFGVKDYLIKADFSPEEVLAKVREYLPAPADSKSESEAPAPGGTGDTPPDAALAAGTPSGAETTLLVVEDDAFLKDLIARRLSKEFAHVFYASDGKQALSLAKEKRPDIILLDLILPELGGFEVLKAIKADPDTAHARVIILSNLGQQEDVEKGRELGAEDFLVKANFTVDEILQKIKTPAQ